MQSCKESPPERSVLIIFFFPPFRPAGHQSTVFTSMANIQVGGKIARNGRSRIERPFSGVIAGLSVNRLRVLDLAAERDPHINVRGDVQLVTGVLDRNDQRMQQVRIFKRKAIFYLESRSFSLFLSFCISIFISLIISLYTFYSVCPVVKPMRRFTFVCLKFRCSVALVPVFYMPVGLWLILFCLFVCLCTKHYSSIVHERLRCDESVLQNDTIYSCLLSLANWY